MYELSDVYLKDVIIIIVEGVYRNNYLLASLVLKFLNNSTILNLNSVNELSLEIIE